MKTTSSTYLINTGQGLAMHLLVLVLILAVEVTFRDYLFNLSFPFIRFIQANITGLAFTILDTYSFLGGGPLYLIVVLCVYCSTLRHIAAPLIFCYVSTLSLNNIAKMLYHEPRPYFVTNDIQNFSCSVEYGNPSGHTMLMGSFSVYICLQYLHERSLPQTSYVLGSLTVLALTVSMGFTRLLLGVHSINQILFGLCLGLWYGSFFFYFLSKGVTTHFRNIIDGPFSWQETRQGASYATMTALAYLLAQIAAFLISDSLFIPK